MKRASIIFIASLLALALIAPGAKAATKRLQVQVPISRPGTFPPTSPGTLTLDFLFKNKRSTKKKFTPRRLVRVDFSKVPLSCANGHTSSPGVTQLQFSATYDTQIKLKKTPHLHPKPGRYSFRFLPYSFPSFKGTISGTIDKPNPPARPRPLRSQGKLNIEDLDVDAGHSDCTTLGTVGWGGLRLTPA